MENDIHAMLEDLEKHIDSGKKVPFTNQYVIDYAATIALVQQIRDQLPEAIKEANRIQKRESLMLQEAKKHQDNVIAEAEAKANVLRRESEQRAELTLSNARSKAEELVGGAQRRAGEMLDDAEHRAQEFVAQDSITIRARQEAENMLAAANREADHITMDTYDHCAELLRRAEDECINAANLLRDAQNQLDQKR